VTFPQLHLLPLLLKRLACPHSPKKAFLKAGRWSNGSITDSNGSSRMAELEPLF
jgi:hypothetical protein